MLPQRTTLAFPFTAGEVVAMGRAPWAGRPEQAQDRHPRARRRRNRRPDITRARRPNIDAGEDLVDVGWKRAQPLRNGSLRTGDPGLRHSADPGERGKQVLAVKLGEPLDREPSVLDGESTDSSVPALRRALALEEPAAIIVNHPGCRDARKQIRFVIDDLH